MTEKNEYTAKVRAKGLDNTGVTEDLAKTMFNTLGRTTLAIVELEHKRRIDDDDTGRQVELVIRSCEPSTSQILDDHLRELTRTMHQNRVLNSDDQQLQLETGADLEPKVEDVIRAGQQHVADTEDAHADEEEEPAGDTVEGDAAPPIDMCPVERCWVLADDPENFHDHGAAETAANPDDPAYDPHTFQGDPKYACGTCDQPFTADVHTKALLHPFATAKA